jgi:hypothetical protein
VVKKEAEKVLKCKDLTTQTKCMWNVNIEVIPVIAGANGKISKALRKRLSNIQGEHKIKAPQKRAISGTVHILR